MHRALLILAGLFSLAIAEPYGYGQEYDHGYQGHHEVHHVKYVPVPKPYPVHVIKKVPYPVHIETIKKVPVPAPYPVYRHVETIKKVPVPVPVVKYVHVPKPYPVHVIKKVPYPVHIETIKKVPVPVPVKVHDYHHDGYDYKA